MRRKSFIIILSVCIISSALSALSYGSDRLRHRFFEGNLSVSPVPLVGQQATISLELTAIAGECESATIQFRTPAGIALLGDSMFADQYLARGSSRRYHTNIMVLEAGSYALQATVYFQFQGPRPSRRAEHFFIYLLAGKTHSQAQLRVNSSLPLTKRKAQRWLSQMLAPSAVAGTAAGGTVSISGYISYYDDNLSMEVPIRRVAVELLEVDTQSSQKIDSVFTDDDGFYSFVNISNVDPEDGTGRDIRLRISFGNSVLKITNADGVIYSISEAVSTMYNVPDGQISNDYSLDSRDQHRGLGHIFNCVMDAHDFLQDRANWSRARITVKWPCGEWSKYGYSFNRLLGAIIKEYIQLPAGKQWNRETILHEYGHAVMTGLYRYREDYLPPMSYQGAHYIYTVSDPGFAMREGWAEFFAALVDDDAYNVTAYSNADTPNIESNSWWTGSGDGSGSNTRGEMVEGTVASILWDTADTNRSQDGWPGVDDDGMDGIFGELWSLMKSHRPCSILEFWDHWIEDGHGQTQSLYSVYRSHSVDVTLPLGVEPVNNPPELVSIGDKHVNENTPLQFTITATDVDPGDILTYEVVETVESVEALKPLKSLKPLKPLKSLKSSKSSKSLKSSETWNDFNDFNDFSDLADLANFSTVPSGASWDPETQQFHWTPDYEAVTTAEGSRSYSVTFKVTDGQGASDQETITITVDNVNRPPEAHDLAVTPASPLATNDLTCSYAYNDADGDTEDASQIRWYRDGDLQESHNDRKIVSWTDTEKGQQWHFTVKPHDGASFGEVQTSDPVTTGNTPPVAHADGPYDGETRAGITFDGSSSYDADGDTLTYSWDLGDNSTGTSMNPTHVYADGGTYTVTLTVNDGTIDSTRSITEIYIRDAASLVQTIDLAVGWNLISLYAQPLDTSVDAALSSIWGKYDSIWTYSAASLGGWHWDLPNEPLSSNLSEVESGTGYWIAISQSCSLIIQGTRTPTAILLSEGWNMVGYSSQEPRGIQDCMSSIEGMYASVWEYDPELGWRWYLSTVPQASNLTSMRPGFGYWIDAAVDCTWDINGSALAAPSSTSVAGRRYVPSQKPEVPYIIWGNVEVDGTKMTGTERHAPVVLLKMGDKVVSSFRLGETGQHRGSYVLDVPAGINNSAQAEVYVQMDGAEVKTALAPPGRPGQVMRFDLSVKLRPGVSQLHQNFPNPFNPETWIPYQLRENTHVEVGIYTTAGQLVRTLNLGHKPAGFYVDKQKAAYWDGRNEAGERVSSGIYFYTIQAGDFFIATKKMVIAK